jgi:hypothetical protein
MKVCATANGLASLWALGSVLFVNNFGLLAMTQARLWVLLFTQMHIIYDTVPDTSFDRTGKLECEFQVACAFTARPGISANTCVCVVVVLQFEGV